MPGFYGPAPYAEGENQHGNNQSEWLRVWRYRKGDHWQSHEPPSLIQGLTQKPVTKESGLERKESWALGLGFDHYAYAMEKRVTFKEIYVGYSGALHQWRLLQKNALVGALIRRYLWWVRELEISKSRNLRGYLQRWFEPSASGARLKRLGPTESRVAFQRPNGRWKFSVEPKAP